MSRLGALAALLLALLPTMAGAVDPGEMLSDPALEQRARDISRNLRCLVCQNESIDDSNATLAHDLRVLVRERLKAGDSDRQVYDFLVARYGDFVLLRPPVQPNTWLLWFGPAAVLALGALGSVVWLRRRQRLQPQAPLSEAERQELARLLRAERRAED
jgi:cytochrome c-type biogenesis protein CcmH